MVTPIDDEKSKFILFSHLLQLTSVVFPTFTLFFFESYTVKKILNIFPQNLLIFLLLRSLIVIIGIRTIIIEK